MFFMMATMKLHRSKYVSGYEMINEFTVKCETVKYSGIETKMW